MVMARTIAVAATGIILLVACGTNEAPNTNGGTVAPSLSSPSSDVPKGTLAQIVTKPGTYRAGVDIEPGRWTGIARMGSCEFRTIQDVPGTDNWTVESTIISFEWSPKFDPNTGVERGVSAYPKLRPGDELVLTGELGPDFESCQFWNSDSESIAPPKSSDLPWRDVEGTVTSDRLDRWKRGQFDFLASVQQRPMSIGESELAKIGFWICKVKAVHVGDVGVKTVMTKFAGLSDIQSDYIIVTAARHMCNN